MTTIFKCGILCASLLAAGACSSDGWTGAERSAIQCDGDIMRVLTVSSRKDSLFLRKQTSELDKEMIASDTYQLLERKMIATVTSPAQNGVGIAGTQVGISRRIVAVQRFDKEGNPFEVYPNIRVTAKHGQKKLGREGCLSVPGRHGFVARSRDIEITYTSPRTLTDTVEHVLDYTAVIFQHECDHLDGILYTDYLPDKDF